MFNYFFRRRCPYRICTGRVLDNNGFCFCRMGRKSTLYCHFCDHPIFDPCGTCANFRDCKLPYKKSLFD